jgi:hypothetical protein
MNWRRKMPFDLEEGSGHGGGGEDPRHEDLHDLADYMMGLLIKTSEMNRKCTDCFIYHIAYRWIASLLVADEAVEEDKFSDDKIKKFMKAIIADSYTEAKKIINADKENRNDKPHN